MLLGFSALLSSCGNQGDSQGSSNGALSSSAAEKAYVAPGEHDEYYAFMSGGYSGNLTVYGLPSGRMLKEIPVFSQFPTSGYGYSEETKPMLNTSHGFIPWGDSHHPDISQTNGEIDGRFIFINENNTPRIAKIDLKTFETTEIIEETVVVDSAKVEVIKNTVQASPEKSLSAVEQNKKHRLRNQALLFGISIVLLALLVWGTRREGFKVAPSRPKLTPAVRKMLLLMGPAVLTGGVLQINLFIGQIIASFQDGDEIRHVVAFSFMSGKEPAAGESLASGFEILGAISARLHAHVRRWSRPEGFTRKTWNFQSAFGPEPLWVDWSAALGLTQDQKAVLERLCEVLERKLAAYGETPDRFGLVHADLRLANLLEDGNRLGVIDFDDCGLSWYVYDFAAAISFLETEPYIPALQEAWIKGYRSVAELDDEHVAMIPTFIMFRRLLLTAWIASHAETETAAEAGHAAYTLGTVALAEAYLAEHGA